MASAHQSKRHVLNVAADASYCSSTIPTVLVYVLRSSSFSHRCLDHGKHLLELALIFGWPVSPAARCFNRRSACDHLRIARSCLMDLRQRELKAALGDGQLLRCGRKPVGARCDDAHGGVDVGEVAGQPATGAGEGFEMSHGHSSCATLTGGAISSATARKIPAIMSGCLRFCPN